MPVPEGVRQEAVEGLGQALGQEHRTVRPVGHADCQQHAALQGLGGDLEIRGEALGHEYLFEAGLKDQQVRPGHIVGIDPENGRKSYRKRYRDEKILLPTHSPQEFAGLKGRVLPRGDELVLVAVLELFCNACSSSGHRSYVLRQTAKKAHAPSGLTGALGAEKEPICEYQRREHNRSIQPSDCIP